MDGNPRTGPHRARPSLALLATVLCLSLVSVTAVGTASAAGSTHTCAFLLDFGNGRMQWVDVPVTAGMTGFDVFKNATETLGLSETHTYLAPYGNTITSIDGYTGTYNFSNPQQPFDFWRLWIWDDSKKDWYFSNTLLDGIDAASTSAIAMIFVHDPDIGPPVATPEYRDPWISSRGDFMNTGSDLSYNASGVELKWQADLGNGAIDAPLVSAAGRLYALTSGLTDGQSYTTDSKLFCLDTAGNVLWSASVGRGHQVASPLFWDGTVYAASADGKLYAFDPLTGSSYWNYTVTTGTISASPLVYNNLIIVVGNDGTVTGVDQNGKKAWSLSVGTPVSSAPALFEGMLYVGGGDGTLYAVKADGSGIGWSTPIGGRLLGSPVALTDRVIVTYSELSGTEPSGGGVAAVSFDGTQLWKTATAYTPGSAAVLKQGVVAISSQGLSLLSLDGVLQWTTTYDSDRPGGSPVTVNGMTYLVTNETNSRLISISAKGAIGQSVDLGSGINVRASPSISDGMLYTASSGGKVIACLLEGEGWTMPPVGLFTYTVSGNTVHFDASSSYGGNGSLSFAWGFDDGQNATGVKVDHTFSTRGNHTIVLTVTDSVGTSRNITKVIDLDNPAAQGTNGPGTGKVMPVTVIVGLAAVVLISGTIIYTRWRRKR